MEHDFAKRRTRTPLAEPSPVPQSSSLGLLLTGLLTGIAVGLFIALLVYLSGALPPAPGQAPVVEERQIDTPAVATTADSANGLTEEQQREAQRLQLEFYQELPNYEVVVDITPITAARPRTPAVTAPATPTDSQTTATVASTPATSTDTTASAAEVPTPASNTDAPAELDPVSAALQEIANRPAPADSATPATTSSASFMLQAGAFQQQATATAQLNRLLGLGLNARLHQENLPGRTLFLVQAGPYASRDEMMQAERVLRSNSIDSMRITLSQP